MGRKARIRQRRKAQWRRWIVWFTPTTLVVGLLAISPTPIVGQTDSNSSPPTELAPEERMETSTINDRLDSNSYKFDDGRYINIHTFEGKAGEQITIELTSSKFEPVLTLVNLEDNKIIEGDRGIEGSAKITVTLPTTGTYEIGVSSTEAGEAGNYTLSWREATEAELKLAEAELLETNTISDRLDSSSYTTEGGIYFNLHIIEGRAGEQITIELTSREFEPVLVLFNPEDNKALEGDRGSGGSAKITLTLPTTGTYIIRVSSTKAGESGNYTLSWREATEADFKLAEAEQLNQQVIKLKNQGQYTDAIPLAERALTILQQVLGQEHLDVATSLNNLAFLYAHQGRYSEAEPLYRQALEMRQRLLGDEHPAVATSLNNLAGLYHDQGRYSEAEPLHRQALEMRQRLLGDEHPDVASSLNNLALLYLEQGHYTEAEPLLRQALQMNQRLLGGEHPDVATSLGSLAGLYDHQGRYSEAEPLYRQALQMNQRLLGDEHPAVASSLNNLAGLYKRQGRYTEAEPLYRQALEMMQRLLGDEHPAVAGSLNNLALLYERQGRYSEAEPLYRQTLQISQRLLGDEHPHVAISLHNLALLYSSQGRYSEAEPLYHQALEMRQRLLGDEHPDVALSLNNLALLYQAQGNITGAVDLLNQGVNIEEYNINTNLAIGSEGQKRDYMATIAGTTNRTFSLHLQDAPNNPQAARLALTTLLRRKGRILDAVTDNLQTLRQNLTPENQELLDKLATTRSQLAALLFRGIGDISPQQYRQQIASLKAEVNELENTLSFRSAEFRVASQPVTIEAVQQLIPDDAALVELALYYPINPKAQPGEQWGSPHYAAYILHSQGEPKWVDLGAAEPINQLITEFRTALQYTSPSIQTIARKLDEQLMQPIRPLLGNTRNLLLSPDSQLNLIPFAALVDESDRYLLENYSITYLTSGRDLLKLQLSLPSRSQPLIVANPDYSNPGEVGRRGDAEILGECKTVVLVILPTFNLVLYQVQSKKPKLLLRCFQKHNC